MVGCVRFPQKNLTETNFLCLENKQLDRNEYNLWTVRTTGEDINDEDWLSIRGRVNSGRDRDSSHSTVEHIGLDSDENISKAKFLKLNDFEVQDPGTSEKDLWNGLKSIGFNYALELDMVCRQSMLFTRSILVDLDVPVQSDGPRSGHGHPPAIDLVRWTSRNTENSCKVSTKSSKRRSPSLISVAVTNDCFSCTKGEPIKLDNPFIRCFDYRDDCGSILVANNKVRVHRWPVRSSITCCTSRDRPTLACPFK